MQYIRLSTVHGICGVCMDKKNLHGCCIELYMLSHAKSYDRYGRIRAAEDTRECQVPHNDMTEPIMV